MPLLIAFVAFIIGIFGFSNIVGAIKYPEACKSPAATATLWTFILLILFIIECVLVPDAIWAPILGYLCSLFLSLNVKRDSGGVSGQQNSSSRQAPPSTPEEELHKLENTIAQMTSAYEESLSNLSSTSPEEAKELLKQGLITKEGYDSYLQSRQIAQYIVENSPSMIKEAEAKREVVLQKLNASKITPLPPPIKTDADKLRELDMELKRLDALYDDISDELKTMATPLEAEQFLNSGMSTQDGYNRWKLEYYSAKNSLDSCLSSMRKLKLERDALAERLNCEKMEDSQ